MTISKLLLNGKVYFFFKELLNGDQNTDMIVDEATGVENLEIEPKEFRIRLKPSNIDKSTHEVVKI